MKDAEKIAIARRIGNQITMNEEVAEFEKAVICLQLELPDLVWRDIWRRWMDLRRSLEEDPNS